MTANEADHPSAGQTMKKEKPGMPKARLTSIEMQSLEDMPMGNTQEKAIEGPIRLFCFPFAGGSSRLFAEWKKHEQLSEALSIEYNFEIPGRMMRVGEDPIDDSGTLAAQMLLEIQEQQKSTPIVLFGHSFGAVVAFEVARRLEEQGEPLLAVFVSASPPPHLPLAKTAISQMNTMGIVDYFASRGYQVPPSVLQDEESLKLFLRTVRADYKLLETYKPSQEKLNSPLYVFGGSEDAGISKEDLWGWEQHAKGHFSCHIFEQQGHYYLYDPKTFRDLGNHIALAVKGLDPTFKAVLEQEQKLKVIIADAFRKVLSLDSSVAMDENSNFFHLGGSSLDTMLLTAELKKSLDMHITQNEFMMHPSVDMLSKRIRVLREQSSGVPILQDVNPQSVEWFPASPGQEQMLSLWEAAPAVYNMPTTIEFNGNLDVDLLHRAFNAVVDRQPALRTIVRIDPTTSKILQKVLDDSKKCFEFKETHVQTFDEARVLIEKASVKHFDLTKPPILRGLLVHTPDTHLLLLNQHHVCSDGWSRTQLRLQLLQTYLDLKDGKLLNPVRLHPNYVDWTMWNRRWLHDYGQKARQIKYWKEKLSGLAMLELPLDLPRPSVLSVRGTRIGVAIDADLTQRFVALLSTENVNPFVGLLSLYMILLHRWSGEDDFAVGIALGNRHHEGIEDRIGYFANEVAIRAEMSESPSFTQILQIIRDNVMGGMANADVPFHEVTEALNLPRDRSRTSVFQAMFALQEREWHTLEEICPSSGDLTFNLKQFAHNTSKFEVHLQLRYDGQGGLEGDFHIATDLFTAETGRRLVEGYEKLMSCCITEPSLPVKFHDITPQMDLDLSRQCNLTTVKYEATPLLDMFASIDRERIAFLSQNGQRQTYGEHWDISTRVAAYLQADSKVRQGDRVGMLMKSSPEAMGAILAILRLGCSHVIVDPTSTPLDRCEVIFADAGVRVVVVGDAFTMFYELSSRGLSLIKWEDLSSSKMLLPASLPSTSIMQGDSIFGVYYTSGTTGKPKGVVISMANVCNLSLWWQDFFSLKQNDRVLLFSSLSFIMCLRQWVPTLCAGAMVVIPSNAIDFESAIRDCGVNKLVCTPSALSCLDLNIAEGIDAVQVAGEPPQLKVLKAWNARLKDLFVGLGPTELCAHALCGRFDGETVCIGRPAWNVRAYVVNSETGLEQPVNVMGELWIAGANVAKGYLNRPDETSRSFTTDPFRPESRDRLYKVGDLARRLPDGRIQFVGRRDKQLKVNGFRIEASEIANSMPSNVLRSHVMVQNGILVAYVMPEVDKDVVISSLEERLPTYMVPRIVVPLSTFPLNKNGKIDIEALLVAGQELAQSSIADVAEDELGPTENIIRLVWMQVLHRYSVSELSVHDNFFEKGGTSLSAVVMSRKLSLELHMEVSVQDIFAYQTIRSLAVALDETQQSIRTPNPPDPLDYLSGGRERLHPIFFGALQGLGLIIMSLLVVGPVLATVSVSVRAFLWFGNLGFLLFPVFLVAGCCLHMGLALFCKWTIIGRYKSGKARLYSWMFLKWWLVRRILHVTSLYTWIFDETSFSRVWLSLLGVRIGQNVLVEQPYILEADLVTIGDDCVLEFEVQLATSEIVGGMLELRPVIIGKRVKLGVRAVVLGGATVHDGVQLLAKASVDSTYSSTSANQVISGSPGHIVGETGGDLWRPRRGNLYNLLQMTAGMLQLLVLEASIYPAASIGLAIFNRFGFLAMVAYFGSVMQLIGALTFVAIMVLLRRVLVPRLIPEKVYGGTSFAIRKWFLDRLLLSPVFNYASQRTLQTSSTFPVFLRLMGATVGKRAWINHPYMRLGLELLDMGESCHMGMLSYFSTQIVTKDGVSFSRIHIGDHASFGQRCVVLGGSWLGKHSTVGAETITPRGFVVPDGGSTFGSPPVLFTTTASDEDITEQTQDSAQRQLATRNQNRHAVTTIIEITDKKDQAPKRRQDVGHGMFWTYVVTTLVLQALIPLVIGISYAMVYAGLLAWLGEITLEIVLLVIPCIFILGSMLLMLNLKVMQLLGGSFSIGSTHFFSWRFFYWHAFADLVYLCTSTVIYPFSGTQFYCMWLRFMGARIGERVFISPENGGFREIDFLDIGDDAVLMTPNIHAHYTDHGMLQFCPVTIEKGAEINLGATIMPLTQYGENCRLRPFSVTVKGQHCDSDQEYWGNPCMRVLRNTQRGAYLFPGQGAQYPGMLQAALRLDVVREMVDAATTILGFDVAAACAPEVHSESLADTTIAQPIMFVAGLAGMELVKHFQPLEASRVIAYAGFSLGEITALCAAGAISFEDSLRLVQKRAKAMEACCNDGAMCNVRGLSRAAMDKLCQQTGCSVANVICSHSDPENVHLNIFVCGGSQKEVNVLLSMASKIPIDKTELSDDDAPRGGITRDKDMCKATLLKVNGAFHTKRMKQAQTDLRQALKETNIVLPTRFLVYSNVTGMPYQSVKQIKKLLVSQLTSPVQWFDTILDMKNELSVEKFIECGPMDQLRKMQRSIDVDGSTADMMISSEDFGTASLV